MRTPPAWRRPRPATGRAHLLLGADEAGGDSRGVDAAVGVLVDLDVGPAVAGIGVSGAVEQVQDLLVVQLCGRGQRLGPWPLPGAPGRLSLRLADVDTGTLGGSLASPGPLRVLGSTVFLPDRGGDSWALGGTILRLLPIPHGTCIQQLSHTDGWGPKGTRGLTWGVSLDKEDAAVTQAGPVMSLALERGGERSQRTEGKAKLDRGHGRALDRGHGSSALTAKAPGVRGDMSLCSTLRRAKAWSPWESLGDRRGEAAWPGAVAPFRWSWPWRPLCWEPSAGNMTPAGAGRWDKGQRGRGRQLGQRPTESCRGRGRSQSSDILSFDGLKGTETPHRKRKRKRKGLRQM